MEPSARDYQGPPIDDPEILRRLPADLAALLASANGFVRFGGGLHVRGACHQPDWHSLRHAWEGEASLALLYPRIVQAEDIPFGEDCLGDQLLIRDGQVWRLAGETGELENLTLSLGQFLARVESDPTEALDMEPLLMFEEEGGILEPGELLSANPPFCFEGATDGIDLRPIANLERRRFLANLASQVTKPDPAESFDPEPRKDPGA